MYAKHHSELPFAINRIYRRVLDSADDTDLSPIVDEIVLLLEQDTHVEPYEITNDILRKVHEIYERFSPEVRSRFELALGEMITPNLSLYKSQSDRGQRERLSYAFLSVFSGLITPPDHFDAWARAYSPNEIALVFKNAVPRETGPILLARKLLLDLDRGKPGDYSFIFQANSHQLKHLKPDQRHKFAYQFLVNLAIGLRDNDYKYSPAQTIAVLFGDVLHEDPDFNADIISDLSERMSGEKFTELTSFRVGNGFGSSKSAKEVRSASNLLLDASPYLGLYQTVSS